MPTENINTVCPLCQSRVLFRFPQDWPTLQEMEVIYSHAMLVASGDRRRQTAKALGIGYRAMQARIKQPLPSRPRLPMSREQVLAATDALNHAKYLTPIGSPGACSGSYAVAATNEDATIFDIRFSETVKGISGREDVAAGKRPTVTFVEGDESQRVFEYGEPCDVDMTVFILPVRAQHCMAVLIKTEFEE